MTEQTRRIAAQIDRVHEMRADGSSDHKIIEALLKAGLDMFEASHAVAQADRENGD
jgi:hypothetical protein